MKLMYHGQQASFPDLNRVLNDGDEVDVSDGLAQSMLARGDFVAIDGEKQPEEGEGV